MSQEALQRIQEAKEKDLTSLDLSYCDLTEIPKEVIELNLLTKLTARGNQITDISFLQPLANLTILNLT